MRTKEVRGVTLVERFCVCPCKKPFWVTKGSMQREFSMYCSADFKWGSADTSLDNITATKGPRGSKVPVPPEGFVTLNQLASLLGASRWLLQKLQRDGELPFKTDERGAKFYNADACREALIDRADRCAGAHNAGQVFRPC